MCEHTMSGEFVILYLKIQDSQNLNEWIKMESSISIWKKARSIKEGKRESERTRETKIFKGNLCLCFYSALHTTGLPGLHSPFQSKSECLLLTNFWEDMSCVDPGFIHLWPFSWSSRFCRRLLCTSAHVLLGPALRDLSSFCSFSSTLTLRLFSVWTFVILYLYQHAMHNSSLSYKCSSHTISVSLCMTLLRESRLKSQDHSPDCTA